MPSQGQVVGSPGRKGQIIPGCAIRIGSWRETALLLCSGNHQLPLLEEEFKPQPTDGDVTSNPEASSRVVYFNQISRSLSKKYRLVLLGLSSLGCDFLSCINK